MCSPLARNLPLLLTAPCLQPRAAWPLGGYTKNSRLWAVIIFNFWNLRTESRSYSTFRSQQEVEGQLWRSQVSQANYRPFSFPPLPHYFSSSLLLFSRLHVFYSLFILSEEPISCLSFFRLRLQLTASLYVMRI